MSVEPKREAKYPVPFFAKLPIPEVGKVVQKATFNELRDRVLVSERLVIGLDRDFDGTGKWRALHADRALHNVSFFDEETFDSASFELKLEFYVPLDYEPYTIPGQKVPSHWCLKGHTWDPYDGKFVKAPAEVKK